MEPEVFFKKCFPPEFAFLEAELQGSGPSHKPRCKGPFRHLYDLSSVLHPPQCPSHPALLLCSPHPHLSRQFDGVPKCHPCLGLFLPEAHLLSSGLTWEPSLTLRCMRDLPGPCIYHCPVCVSVTCLIPEHRGQVGLAHCSVPSTQGCAQNECPLTLKEFTNK